MGEKCRLNGNPAERARYRLHVAAADEPVHSQADEAGGNGIDHDGPRQRELRTPQQHHGALRRQHQRELSDFDA